MEKNGFKSLENEISVYKNNLLGYYNFNNVYMVNQDIIDNIMEYPKVVESQTDNSIFCSCYLCGFGTLNFQIEITKENNMIVSTMYLLENISKVNGYVKDTMKTPLVRFEAREETDYLPRILYAFKLCDDSSVMEQPSEEETLKSYIYVRKHFNQTMFDSLNSAYNKEFKELVDKQINYLKSNKSEFSKTVLNSFNAKEKELKDSFLKNGKTIDYYALFELLNMCVEETIANNLAFTKHYKDYCRNLYLATQFAMRSIKEQNMKYRADLRKKMDAEIAHNFMRVMNNKELLTKNDKEKAEHVVSLGDVLPNGLCLSDMRQYRAFFRGHMRRWHALKDLELSDVVDYLRECGNRCHEFLHEAGLCCLEHAHDLHNILDDVLSTSGVENVSEYLGEASKNDDINEEINDSSDHLGTYHNARNDFELQMGTAVGEVRIIDDSQLMPGAQFGYQDTSELITDQTMSKEDDTPHPDSNDFTM